MTEPTLEAPGRPGVPPTWTSSAKSGIGTAGAASSRVWFTISHGILNEIYYPRPDFPCTRDMGLIVTDNQGFFSEEKRHTSSVITTIADGVPAYRLTNTCLQGRYRIEKEIVTDRHRDVLLMRVQFIPLVGNLGDYRVHVLLSPHLGKQGSDNSARLGESKGMPILVAERDGLALALTASVPWAGRSVGFVGVSDGWQDLKQHGRLTWFYDRAEHGNVALVGEINMQETRGVFVLALGFGGTPQGAAHLARTSLLIGFDKIQDEYVARWQTWQESLSTPGPPAVNSQVHNACRLGATVLRCHEDTSFAGGSIASLSIPWGFAKGDDDLGGYHLVWPRDLVEIAGGLLAVGAHSDARRILDYLRATQEPDGRWPQNMWLDGTTYWNKTQMDETALPILLVDLARRNNALDEADVPQFWPMVRLAAGYLIRTGPSTQQGRWEENSGYTAFTLATEIAALLVAAEMADIIEEPETAAYLRETADNWNASIEEWCFAVNGELAQQLGAEGYYVRIAASGGPLNIAPWKGVITILNRQGLDSFQDDQIVSPDALALVRFGLRAADDPRIVGTVQVIDAFLKLDTPYGPAWHRYNNDGYGEHEDGAPFDGTGIGRAWPLLTGERGHYELAAGRYDEAARLLDTMGAFASDGGLIPEQIWDAADIPDRELFFARPSGSAMPLAWAHAEYLKLARSIVDGQIFDQPPQTTRRYLIDKTVSTLAVWRFDRQIKTFKVGHTLRVELPNPTCVQWNIAGVKSLGAAETKDTGLGVHWVDLPTSTLSIGSRVTFTPMADSAIPNVSYTAETTAYTLGKRA